MELHWDAIGAGGEILGAAAVLITLVYLAKEMRQTQSSSQLSASERLLRGFDEINRLIVADAILREVLVKEGELSAAERLQLYQFTVLFCNIWVSAQSAYDRGRISTALYRDAARDVVIELGIWPRIREPIQRCLERYPHISDTPIFAPLRRPT